MSASRLISDNSLEFCTRRLVEFYDIHGISHQISYPHTSQQNGVAEKKQRHILNIAKALLIHNSVPQNYWGDAVLTTYYLINRLPFSVIHEQIPWQMLYPNDELFDLPPKTFGCVAFVHLLGPGRDKLAPRAIKCVFFGYSCTQKGYQCFDLLH